MPVNAPNVNLDILAPSFNLKNIDNQNLSLDDARGENGTVVVFICNHCPYVKKIANRLKKDSDELLKHSINTIAIMSNDVINYPDDSFENMKIFSKKYEFNFPYLYDETQEVAKKYDAVCTPDFYGFDANLKLKYRGRIDSGVINMEQDNQIKRELFNAMIKIKDHGVGPSEQFNSIGCSIKWK
ncbi:thioredoxin family protein [Pelagibacteraceae bacterium]|nr:thioredoxin family protein [Pelagibacteraceae bacterium]